MCLEIAGYKEVPIKRLYIKYYFAKEDKIFRSFSAGIIQPKVEETSTLSVHRTKIFKDFSFPLFPSHYLCFSHSWQVQDLSQVFALSIFWWFSTFKNRKPNSAMIMFWQKAITQTLYITDNLLSAEQISHQSVLSTMKYLAKASGPWAHPSECFKIWMEERFVSCIALLHL